MKHNDSKPKDAAKAFLRGKFTTVQPYVMKQEKSQLNNLILYLKHLKKEEQTKLKICRRKEFIKIRTEKKNKENNSKDQWN